MKRITTTLAVLLLSLAALARNEPADLPIFSDAQTVGPIEVIREQQYSGAIRLVIRHNGKLATDESESITANLHIFYWEESRAAAFTMQKIGDHLEVMVSNGCLVGEFGGCALYGTQEMRRLLYWTVSDGLQLNALNFELSFVNSIGDWDNLNNKNYQFSFPQHNSL